MSSPLRFHRVASAPRSRAWIAGILAGAALQAGCADGSELTAEQEALVGALLAVVETAPEKVAFEGVRTIESFGAAPLYLHLVHTERVQADGAGNFAIEPLEVIDAGLLPVNEYVASELGRVGWNYRYRDFRVHDAELAMQNYVVTSYGEATTVADRACQRLSAKRSLEQAGPGLSYTLDIDVQTGLVLRQETYEVPDVGPPALVYRSEYESIQMGQPASFVPHVPANGQHTFTNGSDMVAALGFQAGLPRIVPVGYELRELAKVVDVDGKVWAKALYTDGIEPLFFLSSPKDEEGRDGAHATGTIVPVQQGSSWSSTSGTAESAVDAQPRGDVMVGHVEGSLAMINAHLGNRCLQAVGRVSLDELHWLLESTPEL